MVVVEPQHLNFCTITSLVWTACVQLMKWNHHMFVSAITYSIQGQLNVNTHINITKHIYYLIKLLEFYISTWGCQVDASPLNVISMFYSPTVFSAEQHSHHLPICFGISFGILSRVTTLHTKTQNIQYIIHLNVGIVSSLCMLFWGFCFWCFVEENLVPVLIFSIHSQAVGVLLQCILISQSTAPCDCALLAAPHCLQSIEYNTHAITHQTTTTT